MHQQIYTKNGAMERVNLHGIYTRGITLFCGRHVGCNDLIFQFLYTAYRAYIELVGVTIITVASYHLPTADSS